MAETGLSTSAPRPNRGSLVDKPASAMPVAPNGFTVSVYAEMRAPRMMVYAPNGDLFVSSPATNTITVLRDANNDGVFEVDQVVGGIGKEGMALERACPLRGRVWTSR